MFSRVVLHVLDKTAVILKPISVTLSSGLGVTCMKIVTNQECPYVTKYARIVTEQSQFILANLANSMAITSKCFIGSSWLSNLAEIFCQQTFSQSVMIIQWKLFKLLSGHRWLHVFPYYVPYKNKHLMLLAYVFSSTLFLATQCWRNKYLKLDTLSQMP